MRQSFDWPGAKIHRKINKIAKQAEGKLTRMPGGIGNRMKRPITGIFGLAVIGIVLAGCGGSKTTTTQTGLGSGTGGGPPPSNAPFWAQWGANPQHTGSVAVAGQTPLKQIADIPYDPFVSQEQASNGRGELLVHYQAVITDGNDVYMMNKSGSYTGTGTWSSQVWEEGRFAWENGTLTLIWNFASDWKPEPNGADLNGWEPVFHPVDANGFIYVPGAGGTIWKVKKTDGTAASHINPFSANAINVTAADTYVAGPPSADAQGNVYYNTIELSDPSNGDWASYDVLGAWLVKVDSNDNATVVSFATLVPNAPAAAATTCPGTFNNLNDGGASLPWPPANYVGTNQVAPLSPSPCGSQRPGINVAPAIAPDGTIYTVSRAHFDKMAAYLVAVNSNLTPKWSASLQGRLTDGCGVLVPIAASGVVNQASTCRFGVTPGVDPTTNAPGSGVVIDQASSSPTVLPDGTVVFGALTNYNGYRGHLFHFDAGGNFLNAYDFGWDSTPAVYPHVGTFSIVEKDNHYSGALYCSFGANPVCQPPSSPQKTGYYITQLYPTLRVEWQFQNPTIDADDPYGYEWCINMPAIDENGNVFVNAEDGYLYELSQSNHSTPAGKLFLNKAIGAAYTPLSIGSDGKLYTQNDGLLFAVSNGN